MIPNISPFLTSKSISFKVTSNCVSFGMSISILQPLFIKLFLSSFSGRVLSNIESTSLFGIKFSSKFSILFRISFSDVFISLSFSFIKFFSSIFSSTFSFSSFSSFFFFFSSCLTPQEKLPFFILIAYSTFLSYFSL